MANTKIKNITRPPAYKRYDLLKSIIEEQKLAKDDRDRYKIMLGMFQIMFFLLEGLAYFAAKIMLFCALSEARKYPSRDLEIDVLAMIGYVFEDEEDYHKSAAYFYQSLKHAKDTEDKTREVLALSDLGRIYGLQGEFIRGLDYLENALSIARQNEISVYIPSILLLIGDAYRSIDDYEMADNYYSESLSVTEDLGIVPDIIEVKSRIGRLEMHKQNYKEALALFEQVDSLTSGTRYRREHYLNSIAIAEANIGIQSYSKAKEVLEQTIKKVQSKWDTYHNLICQALEQLSIVYSYLGYPQESERLIKYSKRFKDLLKPGAYNSHQHQLERDSLCSKFEHEISEILDKEIKEFEIRGRTIKFGEKGAVVTFVNSFKRDRLTPYESLLLKRLRRSQGSPVSVLELAREIEPNATDDSPIDWREKIKVHIANIRSKLQDDKGGSIIRTVRHKGWMLSDS